MEKNPQENVDGLFNMQIRFLDIAAYQQQLKVAIAAWVSACVLVE